MNLGTFVETDPTGDGDVEDRDEGGVGDRDGVEVGAGVGVDGGDTGAGGTEGSSSFLFSCSFCSSVRFSV